MAEQWRILVVEGEENLNWNIVNSLQKDGYLVLGVTGGAEAIRTLWSEEYDVVICSQQMPDADGFELLQWMRTYCPNTRMVMLGKGDLSRAQALEQGITSYLEKPVDLQALREELRRLLHQSGFSASLDSFDLLDVIQIINMSHKSIALVVNTGLEEQGILRFQAGELIWAEYGILRGEEAFYALAAHKNGTVVHRPWSDQALPNVTQPISRLIFQALQYRAKYAEYQQGSSEIDVIRPHTQVPALPSIYQPGTTASLEEDRPFQFVAEEASAESSSSASALLELMGTGLAGAYPEQAETDRGVPMSTEAEVLPQPAAPEKAWWEPTGTFPVLPTSGNIHTTIEGKPERAPEGPNIVPATVHKTAAGQQSGLPSWLTDQPTNLHLPVMRTNTGQTPAVFPEQSPDLPKTPPAPAQQDPGTQWPTASDLSESGLRSMKREDSMFTNPHRAIRPGLTNPSTSALHSSPVEWQGPLPGQSGQMDAVTPQGKGTSPLQSLEALKRNSTALPDEAQAGNNATIPAQSTPTTALPIWEPADTGLPGQRNYPALAAALQTLGYSVPGFIAAAVAGLDGTPIAQVTIDDTDISPLCTHLSTIAREALHTLWQDDQNAYEHIVISGRARHTLLRLVGKKKNFLQVLVTTRESDPAQSLVVMANVEDAITATLQ
jgi:DNA-binding response OmpR family regulator/predicted regulator of Ras-like GTPase activity (Roadblock/LC7/MglB family)